MLVSQTRYNDRGEAFESVDPAGIVTRTEFDDAGQTVRAIQNYLPFADCLCPGDDVNVTTEMVYASGLMVKLIAKNRHTGDQVTRYQFGVTLEDSAIASNDLLRAEIYPDSGDGEDAVIYSYNRRGEKTSKTDQNGTRHEYEFDLLGRPTDDRVVLLGEGVDGAVLRIGTTYEVRGKVEKITSYDAPTGGNVVNEVQNEYNDFIQLVTQYQEHEGAVNPATTPKVQYSYADGSQNTTRLEGMTYPDGRMLQYLFDDEAADKLSRVRTLRWDGEDVCRYTFVGLGTFVRVEYPEPQIQLDYITGAGTNPYAGFDRFGRVIDLPWIAYGPTSSSSSGLQPPALVHLQYGYDRASNRTHRADLVAAYYGKDFDELYEYDGVHRLKKFHRGRLIESDTVIDSPTLQQGWVLDSTGNWRNFTQNDQADATQTLDQLRAANPVNEINAITRTVGPNWATPQYDRNGNMTVIPQPKDMQETFRATWDAWNRLVKLVDEASGDTVQVNQYDGQTWRTIVDSYADGELSERRGFYYSGNWQCLEERVTSNTHQQYVWGLRYIDDQILRDRNPERHYSLQDANWNVVAIASIAGTVQERFAYAAYGLDIVVDIQFELRAASEFAWQYRFTGRLLGLATGAYDYRNRVYHNALGTFISRDPLLYDSGSLSLYDYVFSSPISLIDTYGLRGAPTVAPPRPVYRPPLRPGSGRPGSGERQPEPVFTPRPARPLPPLHEFSGFGGILDPPRDLPYPFPSRLPPGYDTVTVPKLEPLRGTQEWEDYATKCWDEYMEDCRRDIFKSRCPKPERSLMESVRAVAIDFWNQEIARGIIYPHPSMTIEPVNCLPLQHVPPPNPICGALEGAITIHCKGLVTTRTGVWVTGRDIVSVFVCPCCMESTGKTVENALPVGTPQGSGAPHWPRGTIPGDIGA